jgi:transposase
MDGEMFLAYVREFLCPTLQPGDIVILDNLSSHKVSGVDEAIRATGAIVLSVDEKSQIQALNRTQPVLPMGLGYIEEVTHDYVRNGTTTLFAALDIASGNVLTECKPRHRHQEFLGFLKRIDEAVPPNLDVHLILDNYAAHKHAKVRAWLAARPRFHLCTSRLPIRLGLTRSSAG